MATYRAQLEEDLRWNERELKRYEDQQAAAQPGTAVTLRAAEILIAFYTAEIKRLRARLADAQKGQQ